MRCTFPAPRCAILLATLLPIIGCQAYQPKPLDLQQHARDWAQRSLDDPAIVEAAARLATPGDGDAVYDAADGLTLREAEPVALVYNADLRAQRLRAKVPLAGAEFAGLWDDPELDGDLLRFTQSVDDPWITGVGLSFTVPLSGRLRVEEDQAWAEVEHAWLIAAQAEWALLAELRAQWVAWSALHLRLEATRDYLEELEPLAQMVDRLVEAGEVDPASARLLAIDAAGRRLDQARLEAQEQLARLGLHALLGLTPDAAVVLVPTMPEGSGDAGEAMSPVDALAGHPDLLLARAAYANAELALERELVKQYPDLQIGPRLEDEEGQSRIGVGFGLPLPLWNRNQRGIAEATAARDATAAEAQATLQRLSAELVAARTNLASADRHAAMTQETLVPMAEQQVRALRGLAELGEVDVLLLREALSSVTEARLAVIDAVEQRASAAARLQSLTNPRWALRPTPRPDEADAAHPTNPANNHDAPADAGTE